LLLFFVNELSGFTHSPLSVARTKPRGRAEFKSVVVFASRDSDRAVCDNFLRSLLKQSQRDTSSLL
jgi:hypothetical protein